MNILYFSFHDFATHLFERNVRNMRFLSMWLISVLTASAALVFLSSYKAVPEAEAAQDPSPDERLALWQIMSSEKELPEVNKEEITEEKLNIQVYAHKSGAYMEMPLDEYLYGVLLAEMPSSFGDEALKAQAVAARTLALYKEGGKYPSDHPHSPLCTSSGHCMAYLSPEDYIKAAGEGGADFLSRVKSAVVSTSGQVLCYDGKPIMAAFHASSYEKTESSLEVWGAELPYLCSVSTPEHLYPERVKGLFTEKSFEPMELLSLIKDAVPSNAVAAASLKKDVVTQKSDAGRISYVKIGDCVMTGKEIRSRLSLRSTDFDVSLADGKAVFSVRGHGHGVGMSQYGANIMDFLGKSYTEILSHYYPCTELASF